METKGVTCKIPLELHQQASEEMQGKGLTVSQYIERVIPVKKEKNITNIR